MATTRFQRLTLLTAATTYLLVVIGAIVRGTGSGMGCPDWPLCHGQVIPPLGDDAAWIEWTHRGVAALLTFIFIRSRYGGALPARGRSQRLTLLLAFTAASVYALILFGAHVTATGAALVFPDWPLFRGQLLPAFSDDPARATLEMSHFLHRFVAAVVGVVVALAAISTWRSVRGANSAEEAGGQAVLGLVATAAALYAVQVVVGALQIWTTLASWAVALHLALGAAIWALLVAAAARSYFEARSAERSDVDHHEPERTRAPATVRDRVSAYVALTKPRIIELLLVTTVPAMVLAARGLPPLDLVLWTLIGGSLAAGGANAINCYIDRDIDELMTRTRRRPLPAHTVDPENALVFGLALGVASFALMAFLVNLVAAFLTLVALAFYVVVYTLLLKRSTPQNIVLGGAAGALPPVIGWAAVTGDITLPSLLLFAVVFYWTPPHFWALSLRLRRDYEAARVPMLPVTHGVAETTRQIALYSVLMVALTMVFFTVARMGLVFFAGALVLGSLFVMQAFAMWREGTDRRAVRLYRYSITYLSALFGLIVLDVFLYLPA